MKNILLVNPPTPRELTDRYYPLGLGYLVSALLRGGLNPSVADLNVENTRIDFGNYEAVCVTATTPQIPNAYKVICNAREANPNIYVVLGGVHASSLPYRCLEECPEIDCIVIGEGENIILELIETRKKGIIYSKPTPDLDELSFPNRKLFSLNKYTIPRTQNYTKESRFTSIITSRGCPFSCYYCWNGKQDQKWRGRSPRNVLLELEEVKDLGIDEVLIEDDQFTLDKQRCIEICGHLDQLGFCWSLPNGVHINTVDGELLRAMRDSGLHHISYGIESGNQDVLDAIGKGERLDRIEYVVNLTKSLGIRITLLFMLGLRHDDERTMQETIDFAKKLNPDNATFGICVPYPTSPMYEWVGASLDSNWGGFLHSNISTLRWNHPDFPSRELCREYSKKAYREFYLRPLYIIRHLRDINLRRLKAGLEEIF